MNLRASVLQLDDAVGTAEAWILSVLMAAITIVVFIQVVFRFVLNDPLTWTDETSRYLLIWISLIGAAAAVRLGAHYGMTIVIDHFAPAPRRLGVAFGSLVIAGFVVIIFTYGVIDTMNASRQQSITLPMRMHWAYLAIPVGSGLMLWHLFARLVGHGPWANPIKSHAQTLHKEPST
jgi:TRAP-type C4-dicarboxylate transport system permease small subunit